MEGKGGAEAATALQPLETKPLLLSDIREHLIRLEETIIFALIERTTSMRRAP